MAAAIPMLPPMCGVATSQTSDSQVVSTQSQTGDVQSAQTLGVNDVSDQTVVTTSATGDSLSASVETGSLGVQSVQSMQGAAAASTELDVVTNAGPTVSLTTAATGNTGEADNVSGGSTLNAGIAQTTGQVSITASSVINASTAQAGDMSVTSQAIANTQGLGVAGGSIGATVSQSSAALTQANSTAVLQYTPGTAEFVTTAVSNNVTATGIQGSAQALDLTQSMTGQRTQAAQFLALGQGQDVSNAATATANNISVSNDGGLLDVVSAQDNESYVRGQAESTSYSFGASTAIATGVGNSAVYGEAGGQISVNNTQTNSGGVEVIASSGGSSGYDLASSATAMGNAVTGYACSACGGVMSVGNSQTNAADLSARSGISFDGAARSATSTATAVGNTATFYVSKPSS